MITVLREIGLNMQYGVIQKADFKIVYVAPMKALAAEVTANFGKRLEALGGWGLGKCGIVWEFVCMNVWRCDAQMGVEWGMQVTLIRDRQAAGGTGWVECV